MDTRPSTDYHSEPVKKFNAEHRARLAAGEPDIDLSLEGLLAAGRKQTGLDRFGDESFLPALKEVLKSLDADANLNPYGKEFAHGMIVGSLKNRLWANACLEEYPGILKRKITAPIVIIGPHRSGTSRIQRMMACDTQVQHLSTWEGLNPAPRLELPNMGRMARYGEIKKAYTEIQDFYPGAMDAHPIDADLPEEEMLLLDHSFCGFPYFGNFPLSGFYQWYKQSCLIDGYRYMATLMRLISWSRGEPEDKPWLLKDPEHMLRLDVLMALFPDAKVIFTHRDPRQSVASIISLMWLHARQHTDAPCRAVIRDIWMDFCEEAGHRYIAQRSIVPEKQRMDSFYDDMNRDWESEMQRIYTFAGLDFDVAKPALAAWVDNSNKENRHAKHVYSIEEYGLTDQFVDERMGFVREHHQELRLLQKAQKNEDAKSA
jgi:hypothetical protein